jgi:DNA-binding winged helix-turn-helix (wHTH) protein
MHLLLRGRKMQGDFRIGERLIRPRLNAIEYDGLTLHLEPKVMQVLVTLALHAGDVVTRQQIREQVWQNVFVGEDVLVRAISEIRRAFQDDPKLQHTVQTVPKVGYRLVVPASEAEPDSAELSAIPEAAFESVAPPSDVETAPELPRQPGRIKPGAMTIAAVAAGGVLLLALAFFFLQRITPSTAANRGQEAASAPVADQKPASGESAAMVKPGGCALQSGGTYEIENVGSRGVVEVPVYSQANGALLDQWKSNAGANQRWVARPAGPYWTFANVSSRKLLDIPRASRVAGVQVDQWQANKAENQNWIILAVGDGSCKIISQMSGLLLDVDKGSAGDGAAIIQYADNDGPNQHWRFRAVTDH